MMQVKWAHRTVYLVGAGPGAADLMTLRGASILAKADVVFHDALVSPEMLALCPKATCIPVGKRCGKKSAVQDEINAQLIAAALQSNAQGEPNRVVRLKGGDPMMFGRAEEEIAALSAQGINVEVVPGITSALAASATLKRSLTLRGVSRSVAFCTFATAKEESANPLPNLPDADTLVVYMGRSGAQALAQRLMAQSSNTCWQADTPIVIIEAISTAKERQCTLTLQEMAAGAAESWFHPQSPALLIIGEVMRPRALKPWAAKVGQLLQTAN